MEFLEIASFVFGAAGVGGTVVAIYIRSTIANTIVDRLDKRYVNTPLCQERHNTLNTRLDELNRQVETLQRRVDVGFGRLEDKMSQYGKRN